MKLLVSVRSAAEAAAAAAAGAGVIDAKEPDFGPLGAVPLDVFEAIHAIVAARAPLSAAIGDPVDEESAAAAARAFAAAGASLVKIGFAGVSGIDRVRSVIAAAVHGARDGSPRAGVVAVSYADVDGIDLRATIDAAAHAGAAGVMVDTSDKEGPGVRQLIAAERLSAWAERAHEAGLLVAVAGRLEAADLEWAAGAGADIAGVRGAACENGRSGVISPRLVRELSDRLRMERV